MTRHQESLPLAMHCFAEVAKRENGKEKRARSWQTGLIALR